MLRKSLIFGSIALLLVMLLALAGCEGPVGPAGAAGGEGGRGDDGMADGYPLETGTARDLEVAFGYSEKVVLSSAVRRVWGTVPEGKTLYIVGPKETEGDVLVGWEGLELLGTLVLHKEAILLATGRTDVANNDFRNGLITLGPNARVTGEGAIVLPYDLDGEFTDGLTYNSSIVSNVDKFPGSVASRGILRKAANNFHVFGPAEINDILRLENVTSLRVRNVDPLLNPASRNSNATIPLTEVVFDRTRGKTLILSGSNNEIQANFEVLNTGTLVVEEGAILEVPLANTATIGATGGTKLLNSGTIIFSNPLSGIDSLRGGIITNNGTIETSANDADNNGGLYDPSFQLEQLLELLGEGRIVVAHYPNPPISILPPLSLNTETALNQHLVIAADSELFGDIVLLNTNHTPFDGIREGRTITINRAIPGINDDDGIFELSADVNNIGTSVANHGLIITPTVNPDVLTTIFENTNNSGFVQSDGVLTSFDKSFTIPNGISLVLNAASPLTSDNTGPYDVIINGDLAVIGGNITPSGNVTIGSDGLLILGDPTVNAVVPTLTLAEAQILTIPGPTNVDGPGQIIAFNTDSVIQIINEPYTTTTALGVIAGNLEGILETFAEDRVKLTDNITLDSYFGGAKAIGSVLFDTLNAPTGPVTASVRLEPDGINGIVNDLRISSTIAGVTTGYVDDESINDFTNIELSTGTINANGERTVLVTDHNYTGSNTVDRFDVLIYHQIRLSLDGLTGPVLPRFHVGIKTKRAAAQ
jgi:hypothetical protein